MIAEQRRAGNLPASDTGTRAPVGSDEEHDRN